MSISCPKCGCLTLASHRFPSVPLGQIVGRAVPACRAGRLPDLISEGIAWIGVTLANRVRPAHECTHCQWVF